MIQIKHWFPKGKLEEWGYVRGNTMSGLVGCHFNGRVISVIPDVSKVGGSKEPNRIRGSSSVKQSMGFRFQPLVCSWLNRVLMLVMRFRPLILDEKFPVCCNNFCRGFLQGIVSSESAGCSLVSDEVSVCIQEFSLSFHAMNINVMRLQTIEDLGTQPSVKQTLAVCKHRIRGNCFIHPHEI